MKIARKSEHKAKEMYENIIYFVMHDQSSFL